MSRGLSEALEMVMLESNDAIVKKSMLGAICTWIDDNRHEYLAIIDRDESKFLTVNFSKGSIDKHSSTLPARDTTPIIKQLMKKSLKQMVQQ